MGATPGLRLATVDVFAQQGTVSRGRSTWVADRPIRAGLAVAGLVAASIAITMLRDPVPIGADSRVPASLSYTVDFVEWEGFTELGTASFELEVRSWADWRQEQTCCGTMTGYVQEWRPDGTMWSGYPGWDTGLLLIGQRKPGDLAVPSPDFSQGRPMTAAEVTRFSGAVLEQAEADYWSAVFSLPVSDVIAYRIDRSVSIDGRSTAETTSAHYVLHSVLGIPLHQREFLDGVLIRELTVTRLDLGQN